MTARLTMTLHTLLTREGQELRAEEDSPLLYLIEYQTSRDWRLTIHLDHAIDYKHFKTIEGAQFYALYLEAEKAS